MLTTAARPESPRMQDSAHESIPFDGYLHLTQHMQNEEGGEEDNDQFHVDLIILDFLAYKATAHSLAWASSSDSCSADMSTEFVSMTADWRVFLAHKHHGRHLTPKVAFRSRLLQFTLLCTHRLHHANTWTTASSIAALREQNPAFTIDGKRLSEQASREVMLRLGF